MSIYFQKKDIQTSLSLVLVYETITLKCNNSPSKFERNEGKKPNNNNKKTMLKKKSKSNRSFS